MPCYQAVISDALIISLKLKTEHVQCKKVKTKKSKFIKLVLNV